VKHSVLPNLLGIKDIQLIIDVLLGALFV